MTQDAAAAAAHGLLRVPSLRAPGLSLDPLRIHQGGNSGYQALNLAVLLGARRIVLLGYDMRLGPAGELHWHGAHPRGLANPGARELARWVAAFATTLPDLEREGVAVINATPGSALDCYPRARLEDAL